MNKKAQVLRVGSEVRGIRFLKDEHPTSTFNIEG
jgi:hypothetical protein